MTRSVVLLAVLAAVGMLASAPPAAGQGLIDDPANVHLTITGGVPGAVAAGDVTGDGRGDLVVGRPEDDANGRTNSGSAFVVFGTAARATVDVRLLGAAGHRIAGARAGDRLNAAGAGTGDVNGDGRDDVLLLAPGADNNDRPDSGSAYVVFGRHSNARVDLRTLGSRGFRIDGTGAGLSGATPAGDVNGDGLDDLIVAEATEFAGSATVYVVYGKATTTRVDLRALGGGGYVAFSEEESVLCFDAAGIGDVNGDGRGDFAVADPCIEGGITRRVVLGRAGSAVDAGGFSVDAGPCNDRTRGGGGSALGDLNGDGLDDVAFGEFRGHVAIVLFGTADPTDITVCGIPFRLDVGLEGAGTAGIGITGVQIEDPGIALAAAGDVDGDGYADVIASTDDQGLQMPNAYAVFGSGSVAPVDLLALGSRGIHIGAFDYAADIRVGAAVAVDVAGRSDATATAATTCWSSSRAWRRGWCAIPGRRARSRGRRGPTRCAGRSARTSFAGARATTRCWPAAATTCCSAGRAPTGCSAATGRTSWPAATARTSWRARSATTAWRAVAVPTCWAAGPAAIGCAGTSRTTDCAATRATTTCSAIPATTASTAAPATTRSTAPPGTTRPAAGSATTQCRAGRAATSPSAATAPTRCAARRAPTGCSAATGRTS